MTDFKGRGDLGDLADADEGILFVFHGGTIEQMTDEFNDTYDGRGGNDSIYAGQTHDTVIGGSGDDDLNGGGGQDWVYGGTGNDTITSDNTAFSTFDQLFGGAGNDVIFGGDGAEVFEGGRGVDSIYGGTNVDVIRILDGDEIDYIDAGGTLLDGIDTLELSFIKSVGAVVNLETQKYHLVGGRVQTILNVEWISGTQKADIFTGTASEETFVGHNGRDLFYGRAGVDNLSGNKGLDTLYGEEGNDGLFGGTSADELYGGLGNDYLDGDTAVDSLYGGAGNDTLGAGSGNDLLFGGIGHDALIGIEGDDMLDAAEGNDMLDGGTGNDTLTSGAGADHFMFTTGVLNAHNVDVMMDFQQGLDLIGLFDPTGLNFAVLGESVDAGEVVNGTRALDDDDHLIYDAATGTLYLDVDGVGGAAKVAFAVLANTPAALTAEDFFLPAFPG